MICKRNGWTLISALGKREGAEFKRKSRALYGSSNGAVQAACAMSKRYEGAPNLYWYAYHPQWDIFLSEATKPYFVLGCMDKDVGFAIDHATLRQLLPSLNTTTKDGSTYWHIHLRERGAETFLVVPKHEPLNLEPFGFPLE